MPAPTTTPTTMLTASHRPSGARAGCASSGPPVSMLLTSQVLEDLAGRPGLEGGEVRVPRQGPPEVVAGPGLLPQPGVDHAGVVEQGGVLRAQPQGLLHRRRGLLVALVLAQGPGQGIVSVDV